MRPRQGGPFADYKPKKGRTTFAFEVFVSVLKILSARVAGKKGEVEHERKVGTRA